MAMIQHNCSTFPGLKVVIENESGEVYASIRAVARLIDKHDVYVRRYLQSRFQTATKSALVETEIITAQGLRSATLLPLDLISDIVFEYKPDLYKQAAKVGLKTYFYDLAGFQADKIGKFVKGEWERRRRDSREVHVVFVNACKIKRHSGFQVHNLITLLTVGRTAEDSRKLPLVGDNPEVGLDHFQDAEELAVVTEAKFLYSTYTGNGDWRKQCKRACTEALKRFPN